MIKTRTPRRKMPIWKKAVDEALWRYTTYEHRITQIGHDIWAMSISGTRVTPSYERRESAMTLEGHASSGQEKHVTALDKMHDDVEKMREYREHIEAVVRDVCCGDKNKETFIRCYWWGSTNRTVYVRTHLVLEAMPFLAHQEWGTGRTTGANRNFYEWRERIYVALADMLGYRKEKA